MDCLVVEVSPPLNQDKEIDNMLGETPFSQDSITKPFMSSADLLLQQSIETEKAVSQQKTKEPSKALLDVLRSRGHMKVLMNPTVQLVEGQTAKFETAAEDFLRVTPRLYKDGSIHMLLHVAFRTKVIRDRGKRSPIIKRHTLGIQVNTQSGESLIIGATKEDSIIESHTTNAGIEATDLLYILNPTLTNKRTELNDETEKPIVIRQESS